MVSVSLVIFLRTLIVLSEFIKQSTGARLDQEDHRMGEYCDTESFHAECSDGEVILMTSARYGRMRVGRCVEYDLGYIDCYSDVLQRLDRRCSGQRKCEVRIPDAEFESTRPCLKELKTYLEVSYTCVKVHSPDVGFCMSSSHVNVTLPVGYIVGQIQSRGVSCDRSVHPWVITAERGQRINLTLFDFALEGSAPRRGATDRDKVACRQYGWLEDSASERLVPLCGGHETRMKDIYFSKGHSVKIWTLTDDKRDEIKRFLIRYSVTGCADPEPSADLTWFDRTSDGYVSVGCRSGQVRWLLRCIDNVWTGVVGNCSMVQRQVTDEEKLTRDDSSVGSPYGIAVGVGALVGMLMAVFIVLTLGYRRRHQKGCGVGACKCSPMPLCQIGSKHGSQSSSSLHCKYTSTIPPNHLDFPDDENDDGRKDWNTTTTRKQHYHHHHHHLPHHCHYYPQYLHHSTVESYTAPGHTSPLSDLTDCSREPLVVGMISKHPGLVQSPSSSLTSDTVRACNELFRVALPQPEAEKDRPEVNVIATGDTELESYSSVSAVPLYSPIHMTVNDVI